MKIKGIEGMTWELCYNARSDITDMYGQCVNLGTCGLMITEEDALKILSKEEKKDIVKTIESYYVKEKKRQEKENKREAKRLQLLEKARIARKKKRDREKKAK